MTDEEFERLNFIADKAMNEAATVYELAEFNQLLTMWNQAVERNIFSSYHTLPHELINNQKVDKKFLKSR